MSFLIYGEYNDEEIGRAPMGLVPARRGGRGLVENDVVVCTRNVVSVRVWKEGYRLHRVIWQSYCQCEHHSIARSLIHRDHRVPLYSTWCRQIGHDIGGSGQWVCRRSLSGMFANLAFPTLQEW